MKAPREKVGWAAIIFAGLGVVGQGFQYLEAREARNRAAVAKEGTKGELASQAEFQIDVASRLAVVETIVSREHPIVASEPLPIPEPIVEAGSDEVEEPEPTPASSPRLLPPEALFEKPIRKRSKKDSRVQKRMKGYDW